MKVRWFVLPAAGALALGAVVLPHAVAQETTANPLDRFHRQSPAWQRCEAAQPANFTCATIKVPLDYRRPTGTTIDVTISRIKTSVAGKRRGVLLFNPGGPGDRALNDPVKWKAVLPKTVQDQYDLIGFDPRGLGKSTPITCGLTADERDWPRLAAPEMPALARSVADKCAAKAGDKIAHITTANTARDMDVIRAVLGEKRISYIGGSYGTYLGAVYTQLFGDRTDRFVLDSGVDPALGWRGFLQGLASGSELAFTRWTEFTAQHTKDYGLGNTPTKVRSAFWDLVARANRKPIDYEGATYNGDEIRMRTQSEFVTPKSAAGWSPI